MVIEVRPVRANASVPIVVTVEGMVIDVRAPQSSKAALPILSRTEGVGMVTVVSDEQPLKALLPILVTLEGNAILTRLV